MSLGISNSTALIAPGRIGRHDILRANFAQLVVPEAVAGELGDVPEWISVIRVSEPRLVTVFPHRIHRGEAEVILLGLQHAHATVVLDDWAARRYAAEAGLSVIGTVGLVVRAKRSACIPLAAPILEDLQREGFRISERVLREALGLAGEG